jgi:nucleoside-diphosphate-sugar epimerase
MRIFVTGGAGFIGSHVVDALLDRGDEVAMADHLVRSPKPWFGEALLHGAQLYVADVRDLNAIRPAFAAARPEVVLHLAARVDVRHSVSDPSFDAQVNVAGTVAVLEAAREVGARRVVMASTAAVYGDPAEIPPARTRRSHRCRRTAPRRPRPSGTSRSISGCTGSPPSPCGWPTCTARARIRVARPASCRSSADGRFRRPRDGIRQRGPDARLRVRR